MFVFAVSSLGLWSSAAQEEIVGPSLFQEFQSMQQADERFHFFFNTPNRYIQNSAYDWQAVVNIYHNEAQQINDSLSAMKYEIMQAQLNYDIGDFSKSVAIAKDRKSVV